MIDPCAVKTGSVLPDVEISWFPAKWQAVIWRNAEFFPPEKIAAVLKCPLSEYRKAADDLGIGHIVFDPNWQNKGYLSIIKANWNLLNCRQLLELLQWDAQQLNRCLHEEDFLFTKVGCGKPDCPEIIWSPLSIEQQKDTQKIKSLLSGLELNYQELPFAFMQSAGNKSPVMIQAADNNGFNFIHGYYAKCGDLFSENSESFLPDHQLKQYAALGVKGVWLHAILYHFCPIPGAERFSDGWEKRLENLKVTAKRCREAGVPLYLYLNEPRGMTYEFFKLRPDWAGADCPAKLVRCSCSSVPAVLTYLTEASQKLFTEVPELAGAFLINMSENATHCDSRAGKKACPRCASRDTADLIAECITAIARGIHAANPSAKVIAEDWAWQEWLPDGNHNRNCLPFKLRVLEKLPADVAVMCISEWGKKIECGGCSTTVSDYSISHPGPSSDAAAVWQAAHARGMLCAAKVQLNNSWELSAVPYIPVPFLVREHLDNLKKHQVEGLMLSWTLGGYPGGNLELLRRTPEELAARDFPTCQELVLKVWKIFSDAFKEYPFSISVIYNCPVTSGPAAPFFLKRSGRKATMVGYPFDDLRSWASLYPPDVFEHQFSKMNDLWQSGLSLWRAGAPDTPEARELSVISETAGCHIRSTCNHIRFVRLRDAGASPDELLKVIEDEMACVRKLLPLIRNDSRLGFEASNHYYYTPLTLAEKLLNCQTLKERLLGIR